MASKYFLSHETINFTRMSKLVMDVCSDVLRDVLRVNIPPPGLAYILLSQRVHLSRNLESRQRQILYPPGGVFTGTLEDLDFSLLYKLIRNLQGINIPPHTNGWGRSPDNTDRSLAANIDRLRIQRNETHGHLSRASLSDADFHRAWGIIRQCISEIEQGSLTGDTYVTAVDNLLTMTMEPGTEVKRKQQEAIVEELKDEQDKITKYKRSMQEKMETQNIKLTFIGNPRAGKTCLMQQLLRKHIKPGGPEPTYVAELLTKRIRYKLGKSAKEREEIEKGKEAELCRKHMRRLQKSNADEGEPRTMAESNTDLYDNSGHHKDHDCIEEGTGGERPTHHMTKPHAILYDRDMYLLTENQRKDLEDIYTEDGGIDDSSTAYVTLFDFGGEKEFYHWHHCIMSANSIYLLVFDVSLWQDTDKQDKIVDEIVDWLKSVATYAKTESDKEKGIPPIILVGSHMDEVEMNEDQVFEEISEKLDKKPEIKDILEHNVQEYFFIMHMDKTDKNTEEIYLDIWCQIEKCVHLQSCWHEKIAGSWLALERKIMMEKEKGIKFLTTQQILKINEDLLVPLKESELVPFLRYLHNAASIFCFDIVGKTDSEILTEREMQQMKVILDINWIVRAFGDIITDNKFVNLKSYKDRQTSKRYKGSAKLTNEVLKLCWGNISKEDCHVLLSVMESLGLITKPRNAQDSQKQHLEPDMHIVPCLLGEASRESVQGILNNASVELTQTLCLIFLNQFVPQTIWDKIIAMCMHKFSECTYHKTSEEGYLRPRRGFVCRNVDDFWNFVLHCKGQMLKLTMFNDHKKPVTQGVGEALRSEIESIVNLVLSKTNQEHQMFRHYLHCDFWISDGENEDRKPNAKIFMENYEYRSFDREGNEFMLTQDHWQIWFGEVNKISDMEKFRDMTKVKEIHAEMVVKLSNWIYPGLKTRWDKFLTLLKPYLGDDVLDGVEDNSVSKLCDCLRSKGWIKYGEYTKLRKIVNIIDVDAAGVIDKALTKLKPLRMLPK